MIHSARPTVSPVATIFICCFVLLDLKSGDGRTDNMCEKMITTGRDCGLAEWIKKEEFFRNTFQIYKACNGYSVNYHDIR